MKKILKYLSCAVLPILAFAACNDDYDVDLDSAYIFESVEFDFTDDVRAKLYTDATGTQALPMVVGEKVTFGYTTTPDPDEVTFPDMAWSSSDTSVATVDDEGTVTAISEGYSIITLQPATINLTATTSLKVVVVETVTQVTSITIEDDHTFTDETYGLPACYTGDTMQLTATVSPEDATYQTVLWTSSDATVASVDAVTGVVTGISVGKVTITATALDEGAVTATHEIYIDQIVDPIGLNITNIPTGKFSFDEGSYTLEYNTYPAVCTKSLITWTSSDPTVATVSNGVVTFVSTGDVTITATCPENDSDVPDGYYSTVTVDISIPAGYYNEHFETEKVTWMLNSSHISNGASMVRNYNSATGEYYYLVTPYLSGTTGRGDIQHQGDFYIESGNYPIICVRIDDVNDLYSYSRNINLDTSGTGSDGNKYSGNLGGSNNKWKTKYKCSDGSAILVYDLSTQSFATGGVIPTGTATFSTFQIKYADIKTVSDASAATYRYFWFMTFASESDMVTYLNEWSSETGITYE